MINLFKLEKLPRSQRLRKIASVFAAAERLMVQVCADADNCNEPAGTANQGSGDLHFAYYSDIAQNLSRDTLFPEIARDAFNNAADVFRQAASDSNCNAGLIRRSLNSVRHLLLAETGRSQADWDLIDSSGKLDSTHRQVFKDMQIYLEDIRSPYNVGAMFRCAESFGAEKIFLSQFCADPQHVRAQRTAMGCVDVIPWERRELSELELPVFAMETGGKPLAEFKFPKQGLLIAGSEELGVSPRALAAADASLGRVSIPCCGAKASLNVSVAFGIVIYAWSQSIMREKLNNTDRIK